MDTIDSPVRLTVGASFSLSLYLHLLHFMALVISVFSPLSWEIKILLTLPVALSWIRLVRGNPLNRIKQVTWLSDGQWQLELADGRREVAAGYDLIYLSGWLTIVSFRLSRWRRQHLLLLSDNTDPEAFRCLRVRLANSHRD